MTDESSPPTAPERGKRGPVLKLALLGVVLLVLFVVARQNGWGDPAAIRDAVRDAGPAGALVFVAAYALLILVPVPASVLTIAGGALFGLPGGLALSWGAALAGACGGFGLGRLLGRDAVDRLIGGRLARADALLRDHGFPAVLAMRLVPVLPFTAMNYAAGLTGVRFRAYALGTAVGMLPGAAAYAAVGAYGSDPLGIVLAVSALVLLLLMGGFLGRRLLRREGIDPDRSAPDQRAGGEGA